MPQDSPFPPDFVWGAASSAYQIEGATHTDGRGESIWDRFCRVPGAVKDGDNGDIACDHYHLWPQDIALLHDLGLNAYRFSIAWPRILPQGRGRVNPAGLDFYSRLVDGMLAAGLAPYATLYHWDLPQVLQDEGGWQNRQTAYAFAEYADVVARHLGDRVASWATLNEPWCSSYLSYWIGEHAPGVHNDLPATFQVIHHLLLGHGLAVPALRAAAPRASVGIVLNPSVVHPATSSEADQAVARLQDGLSNRIFLDPLCTGRYPADVLSAVGADLLPVQPGDLETIAAPLDFLGVNYYTRQIVCHDPAAPMEIGGMLPAEAEYTDMGWEVYPDGLRELLERLHTDYPFPAYYVTENGAATPDELTADGHVHDTQRVAYLDSHLAACATAIAHGVPLKGYFAWSVMDNFEWAYGYGKRFGIVYVDYATQARLWKDSAHWYQHFIAESRSGSDGTP